VLQCCGGATARWSNFLDLDPAYRDAWGRPLLRMTFDFPENDQRMSAFLTDRAVEIGRAMGAGRVEPEPAQLPCPVTARQALRGAGGAIMGDDPRTSAVNRYLQSWDIPNLFVVGASAFPQAPAYDPEGALGALAGWCAAAIRGGYLRSPGPMVLI
jgi:gluconate 2-dehydrogenase alpha chain